MFNLYHFIFQRLIWKITPTPISRISTLIPGILTIPTLISRIPIIPLILPPNSPFQLFSDRLFHLHFPKLKFIVDLVLQVSFEPEIFRLLLV